jgi:signal peptidase II
VRRTSNAQRLFLLAFVIWAFDFLSKNWAVANLSAQPRKILGSFLQLTLLRNPGAAFSAATGFTIVFTSLSIVVAVAIIRYSVRLHSKGWTVVAGLVLGGVLGNLSDRIFRSPGFLYGHVVDWIQIPHWPIFNLADSAISIAAIVAILLTIRNIQPFHPANQDKSPTP